MKHFLPVTIAVTVLWFLPLSRCLMAFFGGFARLDEAGLLTLVAGAAAGAGAGAAVSISTPKISLRAASAITWSPLDAPAIGAVAVALAAVTSSSI